MARSKAERDRAREDLLLAIDELGHKADTERLALAVDSTYSQVRSELKRMERAKLVRCFLDRSTYLLRWVRADSTDAALDVAEDLADIRRQECTWEPADAAP
jgi:hypothetical protein